MLLYKTLLQSISYTQRVEERCRIQTSTKTVEERCRIQTSTKRVEQRCRIQTSTKRVEQRCRIQTSLQSSICKGMHSNKDASLNINKTNYLQ